MKSTLLNMTAVLFAVTLVASAGVGAVHLITEEPIARARAAAEVEALERVLPSFAHTVSQELVIGDLPVTVYTATDGEGRIAGYAVKSETRRGFGGVIRMMTGFGPDGRVLNVNVPRPRASEPRWPRRITCCCAVCRGGVPPKCSSWTVRSPCARTAATWMR